MHIDYYNNDDRNLLLPLFALADDSRAQIATYIARGEVLVARDGDLIVGICRFSRPRMPVYSSSRAWRLRKNVSARVSDSTWSEQPSRSRARNSHRLTVSTATADIANLRFYQRQGFRMY